MKAVIFAGGRGTRLRPLTNDRPKPMVEVGGKPIIEWQINWLKKHGVSRFLILGGYLINVISDYLGDGSRLGVSVECVDEGTPIGSAGALANARGLLKDDDEFFAVNGDTITNTNVARLAKQEYVATIALFPFRSPYGIVSVKDEVIEGFEEKPMIRDHWINGGLYHIRKDIFDYLPKKGDLAIDVFPKLASGRKLGGIKFPEVYVKMIDAMKDIEEANSDFASGILKRE